MEERKSSSFAAKLKSLREAAGLSQYALAKQSGITKQSLSKLEMGESEPAWTTVQLLAAVLEVSCEEFVDPEVKPPPMEPAKPRGRPRKDQVEPQQEKEKGKSRKGKEK